MRLNKWLAPLVFLLLPFLPLWRTLTGQSIGPFDQVRQMAPWNGPRPSTPWDVLQVDGVLQFYPWRDLVLESWSKGQVPLWNNFELAGTPLLANSQSGGLYPPHVLLGILHFPTALAIVILAWFHLAWAGLGAFKLSRSMGGSQLGGFIAGASFCLCPFMLAWTALASVITTVCWIPWILWAITELFFSTQAGQVQVRRLIVALSGSVAMMLLGGHLQFAFYGLLASGLFVLVAFLSKLAGERSKAFPTLMGAVIALILGTLISAAQLLPVTNFGKLSNRQNNPTEEGYAAYTALAIKPFELGSLANPAALGYPRDPVSEENPGISTYWPAIVKNGANYAESAICLGPLVLALLGLVTWRDRQVWPLATMGGVTFLLCVGSGLNRLLYFGVPGWSATGSPGRVVVLFVLAACCLAGSAIKDEEIPVKGKRWMVAAGLLALGVLCSLYAPMLAPATSEKLSKTVDEVQAAASGHAMALLLSSTVLGAVGLALLTAPRLSKFRNLAAAVPVLFCGLCYGTTLVSTGVPLDPVKGPPEFARVAYLNNQWDLFGAAKTTMPPNLSSLNGIHELGGYDSLMSGETVEMLTKVNGGNPAPDANGNIMFIKIRDDARLKEAGVSFVGTEAGLDPISGAPGRVSLSDGTATITAEDFSSVTVEANGAGTLTLRDRMMPGWSAEVDGKSVTLPAGVWRVVTLDSPGRHVVKFSYAPPGFKLGLALSLLGLIGVVALLLFGPKSGKGKQATPAIELELAGNA